MSPREKANTKKVEVFLPEKSVTDLRIEAEKNGMTLSGLIRMIVLEHLDKKK